MFEFDAPKSSRQAADGLFLERLDAFMDRSLAELKSFSEREGMPLDETRMHVAEWHSRYLFQSKMTGTGQDQTVVSPQQRQAYIRTALCDVSRVLESLEDLAGVHSFVLAVDQGGGDGSMGMGGFLGGTVLGREFWRNLRGGGEVGAKAFEGYCVKHSRSSATDNGKGKASEASSHQTPAQTLKAELYERVRTSLRTITGSKSAEMKWKNPDSLVDLYGIKLVGWPSSVPLQNPSTMKVGEMKELIAVLNGGTMKFVRAVSEGMVAMGMDLPSDSDEQSATRPSGDADREDYSWALQDFGHDDDGQSPIQTTPRHSRAPDGPRGSQRELDEDDPGPRKRPKTS